MVLHNNIMNLVLIEKKFDDAVFARLDGDGSVYDYVLGRECVFNKDTVTWSWGHYNLTIEQALAQLRNKYKEVRNETN